MNELSQILSEATAAIERGYFHLNIDGGHPVYGERVYYCYELYHQMRLRWPSGWKLTDAQKAEPRRRRAEGATLAELARSYNVSPATISRLAG